MNVSASRVALGARIGAVVIFVMVLGTGCTGAVSGGPATTPVSEGSRTSVEPMSSSSGNRATVEWGRGAAASGCSWGKPCDHVDVVLAGYQPNSSVRCSVAGIGAADWTHTFIVNGEGAWTGEAPKLFVGSIELDGEFGTCRQA